MASDQNNTNLKRICAAFQLTDQDLVEIMSAAEQEISKNQANRWRRGKHETFPDGSPRFIKMTNFQFDMFCKGLEIWQTKKR